MSLEICRGIGPCLQMVQSWTYVFEIPDRINNVSYLLHTATSGISF